MLRLGSRIRRALLLSAPLTLARRASAEAVGTAFLVAAGERLEAVGLTPAPEDNVTCCYALQDKVWVHDPAGAPWEIYTVKDDDPAMPRDAFDLPVVDAMNDGACC